MNCDKPDYFCWFSKDGVCQSEIVCSHKVKKTVTGERMEDVKTDLLKIAGEIQARTGIGMTISDTIKQLIKEYRAHKEA